MALADSIRFVIRRVLLYCCKVDRTEIPLEISVKERVESLSNFNEKKKKK